MNNKTARLTILKSVSCILGGLCLASQQVTAQPYFSGYFTANDWAIQDPNAPGFDDWGENPIRPLGPGFDVNTHGYFWRSGARSDTQVTEDNPDGRSVDSDWFLGSFNDFNFFALVNLSVGQQIPLYVSGQAGNSPAYGAPMVSIRDNGVSIGQNGGFNSLDIGPTCVFETEPGVFENCNPSIALDTGFGPWIINTFQYDRTESEESPAGATLNFYYDSFQDDPGEGIFGATPVVFAPGPNGTLFVGSDDGTVFGKGRVGVGLFDGSYGSPETTLHVKDEDGAALLVEDIGAEGARSLFKIKNNGPVRFAFENVIAGDQWVFNAANGGELRIAHSGTGAVQGTEMKVRRNGDVIITGALTQNSDVNAKQDIKPLDHLSVLAKVMDLPITEWSYIDNPHVRHVGPMAQDFYASFNLGESETGLSSIDTGGVALAAIKAVKSEKDAEIASLKAKLREQEERVVQMEMALLELMRKQDMRDELTSVD